MKKSRLSGKAGLLFTAIKNLLVKLIDRLGLQIVERLDRIEEEMRQQRADTREVRADLRRIEARVVARVEKAVREAVSTGEA